MEHLICDNEGTCIRSTAIEAIEGIQHLWIDCQDCIGYWFYVYLKGGQKIEMRWLDDEEACSETYKKIKEALKEGII